MRRLKTKFRVAVAVIATSGFLASAVSYANAADALPHVPCATVPECQKQIETWIALANAFRQQRDQYASQIANAQAIEAVNQAQHAPPTKP